MSFLTPLYVLGALAVIGPIVFHLIRRMPRGEVPFSSLMFLQPTPPRLTRRSRLDQILLLLLRATALILLAFAFARPFLREAAHLDFGDVERGRLAILIDTSASMRRGDLWPRAKAAANEVIASARPNDQIAVFAFDRGARPLLGFNESQTLDASRRQAVARGQIGNLSPGWAATDLGQALVDAVAAIEDVGDATEKTGRMPRKIVLISDLQQGSKLDALGSFEWPSDVELELRTVSDRGSNAGLQWLADAAETGSKYTSKPFRVRVANDAGSRQESFQLTWIDDKGTASGAPVDVYVPPGESRVVRLARPEAPELVRSLRLKGDSFEFDNTLYVAAAPQEETAVVSIGNDAADDSAGLFYYLKRVFEDAPVRKVRLVSRTLAEGLPISPEGPPGLVVLAGELKPEHVEPLKRYIEQGGTLLFVLSAPAEAATLAALAGSAPWVADEANVSSDVMLGEIAFDHPLFAPLAGPQFNDFTKIHFWKYRRLSPDSLGDAHVIARFENGDAAIVEKPAGKGRMIVFASGWSPADSQLARSSKFVPLLWGLLESWSPQPFDAESHQVGDRVALPAAEVPPQGWVIRKPDGNSSRPAPGGAYFADTGQPGLYQINTSQGARAFAVNLDPAESKIAPLHVETLEQFGCRLASPTKPAPDREHLRQLHNAELEGRQKLWRWVILTSIGILILETLVAGWRQRSRSAPEEGTGP